MLVISNTSWIIKLGSVIHNYINYMEKHYQKLYADIIYPAIYEKDYEEPVQLDLLTSDDDELDTASDLIDKSNKYAKDKNKFKKDNPYRFQPKITSKKLNKSIFDDIDDNSDIDIDEEEEE